MLDRSPESLALIYEALHNVAKDLTEALAQRLEVLFDELLEKHLQPELPLEDEGSAADIRVF